MLSGMARRLFVVALSVALAIGLSAHAARATHVGIEAAVAMAADMPMSGKCDDCGSDPKTTAACAAHCAGVVALPVTSVVLDLVPVEVFGPRAPPSATDHAVPPDPYPPRLAVLS